MLKKFQILGFSAGIPTQDRGVSCMMIITTNYDIMIDCGEGSYLKWKKYKYKWKNLKYIILTHMHPDHIGGLIPLLFYRKINKLDTPLNIIGPPNLEDFIYHSFQYMGVSLNQNINIVNIENNYNISLDEQIKLNALEMKHKIPCWGYSISDNKKKIVFITDTLKNRNTIKLAKNADILIHESTYEQADINKATQQFHTTNIQAMELADQSNIKRLILTHFSGKLKNKDLSKWIWNGQSCVIYDKIQTL